MDEVKKHMEGYAKKWHEMVIKINRNDELVDVSEQINVTMNILAYNMISSEKALYKSYKEHYDSLVKVIEPTMSKAKSVAVNSVAVIKFFHHIATEFMEESLCNGIYNLFHEVAKEQNNKHCQSINNKTLLAIASFYSSAFYLKCKELKKTGSEFDEIFIHTSYGENKYDQ